MSEGESAPRAHCVRVPGNDMAPPKTQPEIMYFQTNSAVSEVDVRPLQHNPEMDTRLACGVWGGGGGALAGPRR